MRKILPLLLFVAIGGVVFGQNIRFSYRVTNPDPANNQSKLTVYISKIGAGSENISGLNYGFYYTNTEATVWGQTAAFLSNNMTAAQLVDFLKGRGKFIGSAGAMGVDPSSICQH